MSEREAVDWVERAKRALPALCRHCRLAGARYEFGSFLIGSVLPPRLEPEIAERARRYLNSRVGTYLAGLWPERRVDFDRPELRFRLDVASVEVTVEPAPCFVAGRYRKLARGMPQSRWPCRACRGEGCARCGHSGRRYRESVEEWIAGPVLRVTGGLRMRMHAMGREDRDARMLGRGRPFVLEVVHPRRRTLHVEDLPAAVHDVSRGRVAVRDLRPADRTWVAAVKGARPPKTYRAVVSVGGGTPPDAGERLARLAGARIHQRTPRRVAHRRIDRERRRILHELRVEEIGDRLVVHLTAEAGLYVKELVSGDEGRSSPSFAGLLGRACRCVELDVLDVHFDFDRDFPDGAPLRRPSRS